MSALRTELRAGLTVWRRELLAWRRSPSRMLVTLVVPIVFLLVFGAGMQAAAQAVGGLDYRTYVYPGMIALAVLMPSFLAAGSVVHDREFGFLRDMLASPTRRTTIVVARCAGGACVAMLHALVVVAVAPLAHVPYDPLMIVRVLGLALLLSFTLVAAGLLVTTFVDQFQTYMSIINVIALPMLLASGAMFPISGLPDWLGVLTRLDPVAYAVDPLRRAVFAEVEFGDATAQGVWLIPSETRVTWGDWIVPLGLELGLLALLGIACLALAIRRFDRR